MPEKAKKIDPTQPREIRMGATWQSLAAWLNVPVGVLKEWRSLPGAPTEPLRREWLKFRDRNFVGGKPPARPDVSGSTSFADIKLRDAKLRMELRLLEAKVAKEERRVVPTSDVIALLTRLGATVKSKLYAALETEAPPRLLGLDAAHMRQVLRGMADDICRGFEDGADAWKEGEAERKTEADKE